MQTETQTDTSVALADGGRFVLSNEQVAITDRHGSIIATINLNDISAVSRGGRDIILTRSQTDPVVLSAATVFDAQQVVTTLHEHVVPPSEPRWWHRRLR